LRGRSERARLLRAANLVEVAVYVLGAPGSGKTTVRELLAERLSDQTVVDWDDFIEPASALAGVDVRRAPQTWPSYQRLLRAVVDAVSPNVVVLGVCAPDELDGWPIERWILLDCDDEERTRRLGARPEAINDALADASAYRRLGLPTIDSTGRSPDQVADAIVRAVTLAP
jgi:GTPase SAR1 family protein